MPVSYTHLGLDLDELEPVVEGLHLFHVVNMTERPDHFMDRVGGLVHHVRLLGEIYPVQVMAGHDEAFGQLLRRLGDAEEPARQRLDVLALQPGDECLHQLRADLLGDLLLLAPRDDEVVDVYKRQR